LQYQNLTICILSGIFYRQGGEAMKSLSNICIIAAVVTVVAGIVSKYILRLAGLQPASYLLIAQIFLLLSLNFLLSEKK
jgi:hypothetical protein